MAEKKQTSAAQDKDPGKKVAIQGVKVLEMARRSEAEFADELGDLRVIDDGEGFAYAVIEVGAVLRGITRNVEQTKYGFSLVYESAVECAVTKRADGTGGREQTTVPPGSQVRVGIRKTLEPLFDMTNEGLDVPFQATALEKMQLDNGNDMWRFQLAVSDKVVREYRRLTSGNRRK